MIKLPVYFYRPKNFFNLGDELGPYIIEKLTKIKTYRVDRDVPDAIFSVGSILEHVSSDTQIIWGSGFISDSSSLHVNPIITAVRGPLTLAKIQNHKSLPIGDPALLLPDIYSSKDIRKIYEIGFIPHYVDRQFFLENLKIDGANSYLIINIMTQDIEAFIEDIVKCNFIVTSSLHGLIIAHAYGIPAVWVEFSNRVIGSGYKFNDYFLSVGIPPYIPKRLTLQDMYLSQFIQMASDPGIQLGIVNFDKSGLYEALDNVLYYVGYGAGIST